LALRLSDGGHLVVSIRKSAALTLMSRAPEDTTELPCNLRWFQISFEEISPRIEKRTKLLSLAGDGDLSHSDMSRLPPNLAHRSNEAMNWAAPHPVAHFVHSAFSRWVQTTLTP